MFRFRSRVTLSLAVGGVAVAAVAVSPDRVVGLVRPSAWSPVTALTVLLGLYLVRPLFVWPVSPFSVLAGYLFGVPAGILVALVGTLLSSVVPFLVAARVLPGVGWVDRVSAAGQLATDAAGPLRATTAARLSPAPSDGVTYLAAAAGVPLPAFALGTALGELPWVVGYVFVGHTLQRFSMAAVPAVDPAWLVVATLGALALVAGPLYRAVIRRDAVPGVDCVAALRQWLRR